MFRFAQLNSLSVSLVLGLIAVAALLRRRRELTGTTLIAPWCWAVASLGFIAIVVALVANGDGSRAAATHLRYLAGASTFCPLMALLGAKRPQDHAWQFVVLTLLIVLALPSAESFLYHPNTPLRLHPAWGLLLWPLVAIGLFNTLPTRYWWSGLIGAAGQVALLAGQLPGLELLEHPGEGLLLGFELLSLSAIAWGFDLPRKRTVPTGEWDLVWRDFRDSFGSLWALRVADRFNAAAETHRWKIKLGWHGFYLVGSSETKPHEAESRSLTPAMETNMTGLLRRFVSSEWIAARVRCSALDAHLD